MTYIFESGLAHHIEGLIQQKRADGYAYNSEEKLLKRFDTFCVQNYPELTTVTYEMAAKWSEARPGEGDAYHNRRMSMVKVLSEYILSLGQESILKSIPRFSSAAITYGAYLAPVSAIPSISGYAVRRFVATSVPFSTATSHSSFTISTPSSSKAFR